MEFEGHSTKVQEVSLRAVSVGANIILIENKTLINMIEDNISSNFKLAFYP